MTPPQRASPNHVRYFSVLRCSWAARVAWRGVVARLLHELPALEHKDRVRVADGGQAVCHGHGSAPLLCGGGGAAAADGNNSGQEQRKK